jgi:outer membrane protein insertion porin family
VTSDSYYYLLKTELRFPIWKTFPFIGELSGAIFYDGGAVYINQPDVNIPYPYRDSVGLGLRIATPVGPLNLEFGWKLRRRTLQTNPEIRESPFAFHFSIGAF